MSNRSEYIGELVHRLLDGSSDKSIDSIECTITDDTFVFKCHVGQSQSSYTIDLRDVDRYAPSAHIVRDKANKILIEFFGIF